MGGSTVNKNWIHPHCIIVTTPNNSHDNANNESNVYSCKHVINSVVSTSASQTNSHYVILDLGATDHYLHQNPNPKCPGTKNYKSITVQLPNGTALKSTRQCTLPIRNMNNNAISGHVIASLNKSLTSIGKLCDSNYTAVFTTKDEKNCIKHSIFQNRTLSSKDVEMRQMNFTSQFYIILPSMQRIKLIIYQMQQQKMQSHFYTWQHLLQRFQH